MGGRASKSRRHDVRVTDSTGSGPQQPQQPAEIDPEQLRQFQEFQRFQEYQKFQQAQQQGQAPLALPPGEVGPASQPPAVPPPPIQTVYVKPEPKPVWQVVLGSKLVRWLVMLVILLLLADYGYNRWFGGGDDPGDIAVDSGGNKGNVIAPTNAYGLQGTVGIFYKHVSQGSDSRACNLFADDGRARQEFTTAFSAPDCGAAIRSLHGQVRDVAAYEQPYFPDAMLKEPLTTTTEISSCKDLIIKGGPLLGKFVLTKQPGSGSWIITDYEAEPADCVGP